MNTKNLFKKATRLHEKGKLSAAKAIYLKILKKYKNHPEAYRLLGVIELQRNNPHKALTLINKAIKLKPHSSPVLLNLVSVLTQLGRIKEAISYSEKLIALDDKNPSVYFNLGNLYRKTLDFKKALDCFKQALQITPYHVGALLNLGHVYKNLGEIKQAQHYYEKVLQQEPRNTTVYWALSNLKSYRFSASSIKIMQTIIDDLSIKENEKIPVYFALFYAFEQQKKYKQAFALLKKGNELKNSTLQQVDYQQLFNSIQNVFNSINDLSEIEGIESAISPIFIVSLPRSGSTLVEQILASHSLVNGASETFAMTRIMANISQETNLNYPDFLQNELKKYVTHITNQYTKLTEKWQKDTPLFSDKTPENFHYIGVILAAFPQAKIINVQRNPMDNCLSCYRQLFASGNHFSYSLENLAEYYSFYDKIMSYWQAKYPNKIINVSYEELISEPESQIKKLLSSCQLESEQSCFEFYKTKRVIRTASAGQVTQPMYKSSNLRWLNYKDELEPLSQYLNEKNVKT